MDKREVAHFLLAHGVDDSVHPVKSNIYWK